MTLTEQIAKRMPAGIVLVAESGIKTKADIQRMGEPALMRCWSASSSCARHRLALHSRS